MPLSHSRLLKLIPPDIVHFVVFCVTLAPGGIFVKYTSFALLATSIWSFNSNKSTFLNKFHPQTLHNMLHLLHFLDAIVFNLSFFKLEQSRQKKI